MKPEEIEALALLAGMKVWADGRITVCDGGVSGSGSVSVPKLVALALERVATNAQSSIDKVDETDQWSTGYVQGVKDCIEGLRSMAEGLKP